jgi:hypothetical protein
MSVVHPLHCFTHALQNEKEGSTKKNDAGSQERVKGSMAVNVKGKKEGKGRNG